MSVDYTRVDDVLTIHADQIERYGGGEGIRDPGLLEAALWENLSQNQTFVDGNKRTAFAATYVFLAINGLDITATDDEAQDFVLGLYNVSSVTFDNLRAWLSENTQVL